MSVIKIFSASGSVDIGGVNYKFKNMVSWTVTDPRQNGLIGSPQDETDGIPTRNNLTQSATAIGVIREVPKDLLLTMEKAFKNQERVRFTLFDKETGRQVVQEKSLIQDNPMNFASAEGEENFNVNIGFVCAVKNQKHSFLEV